MNCFIFFRERSEGGEHEDMVPKGDNTKYIGDVSEWSNVPPC